jgi:hypothetical protein
VGFDPTPEAAPDEPAETVPAGPIDSLMDRVQDLMLGVYRRVRVQWKGNVIGYSRRKQRRLVAGFSNVASGLAARAAGIIGPLWPGVPGTGLVQVAALVVLLTLVGMGLYLVAKWLQGQAGQADVPTHVRRTLWFYREMLHIMRRKGILRPEHMTPREFVAVAAAQLAHGKDDVPTPQKALELVTDVYYLVRFGGREPTQQQAADVRLALDVLRKAPRAAEPQAAPAASGGDVL